MKTVTLLVGPQGSGKSTFASMISDHETAVIVSQDEMGKAHWQRFNILLGQDVGHIIVDRINHIREQRAKYLKAAKDAGYRTQIITLNEKFDVCLERILNREDHPTLKKGDRASAIQALRMYFTQYERPSVDEADVVQYSKYDPYIQDLNSEIENIYDKRVIVIGDLHGCYSELVMLLKKLRWDNSRDIVILTGDVIDRGPEIKECISFAMNTKNVYTIMSNHEWKLARHLASLGSDLVSKVKVGHGMQQTIDQCKDMFDDKFLGWLWSLPLMIKFNNHYVIHAGINPRYPIHKQNREFLLYARKFEAASNSFSDENAPYWYEHPAPPGLSGKIFFGHEVHESGLLANCNYAYPVDGGCVFGEKLRAAVVVNQSVNIVEINSNQPKEEEEGMYSNWWEPYEERFKAGYLAKQTNEDKNLVLYNYTDKCSHEKKWDKYTLECRGLILGKHTGQVIAKPFPKFFNVGETQETQLNNLPKESYRCYEKMDGSLGIVYHYDKQWRVATRGSFSSMQAQIAEKILEQYDMSKIHTLTTLLVEIIYPENRHNAGARLVVDYGTQKMLCLLAAYNRDNSEEFHRGLVSGIASLTGMPLVKQYDHTIEEMIAMQKTLPADKEGFVVRFESGFRIKIKGDEYMKLHRILNSITPLFIWDLMLNEKIFVVPSSYLMSIPEEFKDEAMGIIHKLIEKRHKILIEIEEDFEVSLKAIGEDWEDLEITEDLKKRLGIWIQNPSNSVKLRHPSAIFMTLLNKTEAIDKYSRKASRPTNNIL